VVVLIENASGGASMSQDNTGACKCSRQPIANKVAIVAIMLKNVNSVGKRRTRAIASKAVKPRARLKLFDGRKGLNRARGYIGNNLIVVVAKGNRIR